MREGCHGSEGAQGCESPGGRWVQGCAAWLGEEGGPLEQACGRETGAHVGKEGSREGTEGSVAQLGTVIQ